MKHSPALMAIFAAIFGVSAMAANNSSNLGAKPVIAARADGDAFGVDQGGAAGEQAASATAKRTTEMPAY